MRLANVTAEYIEREIQRIGGALALRALKVNEELGAFGVVHQDPTQAPLGDMIRDVFAHAVGDREVEEVFEQCQDLCEMLWSPPTESGYEIPGRFWDTLLGQAIVACIGDTSELTESQELTISQACRLAGVGRATLHGAAASGELPVARMVGTRRLFQAGDVRAWHAGRVS